MYNIKTDHKNCRGRPPNKSPCREGPHVPSHGIKAFARDGTHDTLNGLRNSKSGQAPCNTLVEPGCKHFRTCLLVNYRAGPFNSGLLRLTLWPLCAFTDKRQRIPISHVRARAWVNYTCFGNTQDTLNRLNQIPHHTPCRQSAEKRNGRVMSCAKRQLIAELSHYTTEFKLFNTISLS
jgi:hypothetical protein